MEQTVEPALFAQANLQRDYILDRFTLFPKLVPEYVLPPSFHIFRIILATSDPTMEGDT